MIHALLAAVVAWSTPQVLSNGAIALGPELAVAPSGAAMAVWDHESGPDCAQSPASLTCAHIVEYAERPAGAVWNYPREIARPGIGARPQVALNDAGRAVVIWVHDIGRDRVVQATYRTSAVDGFPNPSDLSAAVLEVRSHHVALDSVGNAAVAWAERHATTFAVAAEMRSAARGVWGAPVVLSRDAVADGPALAATPQSDVYAVWIERAQAYVAHGDLRRGTWDAPVALSGSGGESAGQPLIATDTSGDVVAAWWSLDSPRGQRVVRAAYKVAGQDWRVQDIGPGTAQDVAIAPTGTAAVAAAGSNGELWAAVRPAEGPWSAPQRIAARGIDSRIALSGRDDAVVVSRQPPDLMASLRPVSAQTWQPLERLSGGDASAVRVGLDRDGNAVAVWNVKSGDALPVYTSSLRATAWLPTLANLRRPSIAGRPRVGRALTCRRGDWSGTIPIRYASTWLRNGRARAHGTTYRVRPNDVGSRLACRVSASNPAGLRTATSVAVRARA